MNIRVFVVAAALLCAVGCEKTYGDYFVERAQEQGYSRAEARCMLGGQYLKMSRQIEDDEEMQVRFLLRAAELMPDCRYVHARR